MAVGDGEAAIDDDGSVWSLDWSLRSDASAVRIRHVDAENEAQTSSFIVGLPDGTAPGHTWITALAGYVLMVFGTEIYIRDPKGVLRHGELPQYVTSIVRSEEQTNPLILIGFAEGFCAVDITSDDLTSFRVLGFGLEMPTLGWTRHGVAVAVDRRAIWLGRVTAGRLPDPALQDYKHGKPWAILPSPQPDEVAFVMAQALVMIRLI